MKEELKKQFQDLARSVMKELGEMDKEELAEGMAYTLSLGNIFSKGLLRYNAEEKPVEEKLAEKKPSEDKPSFLEAEHCTARVHCVACRTKQQFRDGIRKHFAVPADFDTICPFGVDPEGKQPEDDVELPEPELPPLMNQLKNVTKAAGRVAKAAIKGEDIKADDNLRKHRMTICSKCTLYIKSKKRCSHPECGCFIEKKAMLLTEKCPEGFWEEPDKQKKFNQDRMARLRKMQSNVVTIDDFLKKRKEIEALELPQNSVIQKIYKAWDTPEKKGCKGCRRGKFTKKFSKALLADLAKMTPEAIQSLRGILGKKEYIMDENMPVTWEEALE